MPNLLFSSLELRDVVLRNRIVVPPLLQYSAKNGFPTDWHVMNAGKFATGGAGLVFVESTKVARRGCGTLGDLGIWDDKFIEPMSRLANVIKDNGAVAGLQISHAGRKARAHRPWEGGGPLEQTPEIADWDDWSPVGASALAYGDGWPVPRELTLSEIQQLIADFGAAAARAAKAGFQALEVHGAHGYLLHSFLSPESNRRTDRYGGSDTNRMRFVVEIIESVRANWPDANPLFLRLSVEDHMGWSPASSVALARIVKTKGVDVIDCSSGGISGRVPANNGLEPGYQVPYAEIVRREAGMRTMAVGLIIHGDQAEEILQAGKADLIGVGREIMSNPNWPMDAAQKLRLDPGFDSVPPQIGYWLAKRAKRGFGCNPSTWQTGMNPSPR